MDVIFTPWRMEYILSDKSGSCLFCEKLKESCDEENLILKRCKHCFVIMNLYPYNVGHLMVVPNKHVPNLRSLDNSTRSEMMELLSRSEEVLSEIMNPQGFNVGVNVGEAAGAGIREHLHIHIVPRWEGDTNFFTTLGMTRAVPENLSETYKKLFPLFQKYEIS